MATAWAEEWLASMVMIWALWRSRSAFCDVGFCGAGDAPDQKMTQNKRLTVPQRRKGFPGEFRICRKAIAWRPPQNSRRARPDQKRCAGRREKRNLRRIQAAAKGRRRTSRHRFRPTA